MNVVRLLVSVCVHVCVLTIVAGVYLENVRQSRL